MAGKQRAKAAFGRDVWSMWRLAEGMRGLLRRARKRRAACPESRVALPSSLAEVPRNSRQADVLGWADCDLCHGQGIPILV